MGSEGMRILMLNYEYPPLGGGAAPVTQALAEHLAFAGHTVDVVTSGYRGLPFREQSHHERLCIYRVPAIRRSTVRADVLDMSSYLVSALPWVLFLTRNVRYDLIHTHFLFPTGVVGATVKQITGLPLVVTIHGSDVPGYNPDRFTGGHWLLQPIWKGVVEATDAIISPSAYLGELLQRSSPAHVDIIPYGFDAPPVASLARRQRILFASRLFPRKGAQHLLQALVGLDLAGWEVIIAGDGPMLGELKVLAERLGVVVQFPGFIKGQALQDLYASSAIFVFPSLHDNFPVVLLEALSHGCAIITNNCSGMPEVIGEAGILVEPGNIDDLRVALARLMADTALRTMLSMQAHERLETFAWEGIVEQHLELYHEVVSVRRRVKNHQ
ncbi:MAG: glycosyltransferase family 1 protein [Chloroflexia bacterium]|nr:glycosyltransferase family 1 protein [Chloroflexia bacterium]